MINKGFLKPAITEKDYIFGSGKLEGKVLRPDGQWDNFLPVEEIQRKRGIETANCISFGSTNQIEIYLKELEGVEYNFSDRALGINAGTYPPGNKPNKVYEKIRKIGLAPDKLLPFDDSVKNVDDYYDKSKITREIKDAQNAFHTKYKFEHDWLSDGKLIDTNVIKTALKYSPLAVAIYAFAFDGKYYIRAGEDGDWITLTGFEDGKYFKGYTSYDPVVKKFAWDFGFYYAKRISIRRRTPEEQLKSLQLNLLQLLQKYVLRLFRKVFKMGGEIVTGIFSKKN